MYSLDFFLGFECPICRRHTPSPGSSDHSTWASLFPINHIIISLIDGIGRTSTDIQEKHTESQKAQLYSLKQNVPSSPETDDRFDVTKGFFTY